VQRKYGFVYGGGNVGLMRILADAVLREGREVIGVIPENLMAREVGHNGLTKLHVVRSMHGRKALMADLSDAFIVLPGGFGIGRALMENVRQQFYEAGCYKFVLSSGISREKCPRLLRSHGAEATWVQFLGTDCLVHLVTSCFECFLNFFGRNWGLGFPWKSQTRLTRLLKPSRNLTNERVTRLGNSQSFDDHPTESRHYLWNILKRPKKEIVRHQVVGWAEWLTVPRVLVEFPKLREDALGQNVMFVAPSCGWQCRFIDETQVPFQPVCIVRQSL
jgi:hypothetical protein